MSHNRFVFAASFSILALAATGLDALWRGRIGWRPWFLVPIGLLVALLAWCSIRAIMLPEAVEDQLPAAIVNGQDIRVASGYARDARQAQSWACAHLRHRGISCGAHWCSLPLGIS